MAMISARSVNLVVWGSGQDLNACFEWPSVAVSGFDVLVLLLFFGVKSMMIVTCLVAGLGVSLGACSSMLMVAAHSTRSVLSTSSVPGARIASVVVFHAALWRAVVALGVSGTCPRFTERPTGSPVWWGWVGEGVWLCRLFG